MLVIWPYMLLECSYFRVVRVMQIMPLMVDNVAVFLKNTKPFTILASSGFPLAPSVPPGADRIPPPAHPPSDTTGLEDASLAPPAPWGTPGASFVPSGEKAAEQAPHPTRALPLVAIRGHHHAAGFRAERSPCAFSEFWAEGVPAQLPPPSGHSDKRLQLFALLQRE